MLEEWMSVGDATRSMRYLIPPLQDRAQLPVMEAEPLVSVIIPNWNAEKFIEPCLSALSKTSYPRFELILVDNGSVDRSVAIAREVYPNANFILNETNLGFAKACNQGFRVAKGSIIVLLNVDTEVEASWLEPLVQSMQADLSVALVGSLLLLPNGMVQAQGGLFIANGLAQHPEYGTPPQEGLPDREHVLYAAGASLAIRADFLNMIGGLDEGFSPAYYEDADLGMKAHRLGLKSLIARRSRVTHHESYASGKASPAFSYLFHRSRFRFVALHFRFSVLMNTWSRAEEFWYEIAGRNLEVEALHKAYRESLWNLPRLIRDRFSLSRRLQRLASSLTSNPEGRP